MSRSLHCLPRNRATLGYVVVDQMKQKIQRRLLIPTANAAPLHLVVRMLQLVKPPRFGLKLLHCWFGGGQEDWQSLVYRAWSTIESNTSKSFCETQRNSNRFLQFLFSTMASEPESCFSNGEASAWNHGINDGNKREARLKLSSNFICQKQWLRRS